MATGKANNWRGRVQPTRDVCPKCGKRGLGPIKARALNTLGMTLVGQHCRYCRHWVNL
jgi:hypothetical protein